MDEYGSLDSVSVRRIPILMGVSTKQQQQQQQPKKKTAARDCVMLLGVQDNKTATTFRMVVVPKVSRDVW